MNVIWMVSDTFHRDHLGSYSNSYIRTPPATSGAG